MDSKVVSALKKLGVIFSSLNVTVKVGAYCASTDGNEIRIPFPDAKTDFQMLTALLMHEASHCRYTDFKADFLSNKLVHSWCRRDEERSGRLPVRLCRCTEHRALLPSTRRSAKLLQSLL